MKIMDWHLFLKYFSCSTTSRGLNPDYLLSLVEVKICIISVVCSLIRASPLNIDGRLYVFCAPEKTGELTMSIFTN
jgi:hypothetical protein